MSSWINENSALWPVWIILRSIPQMYRETRLFLWAAIFGISGLVYQVSYALYIIYVKPEPVLEGLGAIVALLIILPQFISLIPIIASLFIVIALPVMFLAPKILLLSSICWILYDVYYLLRYAEISLQLDYLINDAWISNSSDWVGLKYVVDNLSTAPISFILLITWIILGEKIEEEYQSYIKQIYKDHSKNN